MQPQKTKIAVVGGGPGGIVALKELRECGFDVTLFERRHDVGGIWTWSEDKSMTTALKETRLCNSKFSLALSDLPVPADYPAFMDSQRMGAYLQSYAKLHKLYSNIEFGKTVTRFAKSSEDSGKWQLTFDDDTQHPRSFDKVVWATGGFLHPRHVSFPGQEQFTGRIVHSQDVRNLDDFKGQNVIVLGIGNTAGDVAIGLADRAKKVYLSHRRGAKIIGRTGADGVPSDALLTPTVNWVVQCLSEYFPSVCGKLMDFLLDNNFKENWGENKPAWGFAGPSLGKGWHIIVCNDHLVPLVKEGKVTSTRGIKRFIGPRTVEMDDGVIIEDIDTIVACVGYTGDLSMLSDGLTFVDGPKANDERLPDLYMGIFPPEHADTLAVLSHIHIDGPQIPARELEGMALAQIWAGKSKLPDKAAMDGWVRRHQQWLWKRIAQAPKLHRGEVSNLQLMRFLHEAAGTGLYNCTGWSWEAWRLWWTDGKLYKALAHGPATSHRFRLFETGKRAAWPGARDAIFKVNAELKVLQDAAAKHKKA